MTSRALVAVSQVGTQLVAPSLMDDGICGKGRCQVCYWGRGGWSSAILLGYGLWQLPYQHARKDVPAWGNLT